LNAETDVSGNHSFVNRTSEAEEPGTSCGKSFKLAAKLNEQMFISKSTWINIAKKSIMIGTILTDN